MMKNVLTLTDKAADQVKALCDRTIWLDEGRVAMEGPSEEVVDAYSSHVNEGHKEGIRDEKKKQRFEAKVKALLETSEAECEANLKACFESLMTADKEVIKTSLSSLQATLSSKSSSRSPTEDLFLRLCDQYPGDVGCLLVFLINYIRLKPGEALFLGPNLVHAYLDGDCIECMACSDNVVRSGLTPKLIDTPTLGEMLDYTCMRSEEMLFNPVEESDVTLVYDPPVPDFAVAKLALGQGAEFKYFPTRESASIILVVGGEGSYEVEGNGEKSEFKKGSVIFLGAGEKIGFESTQEKFVAYQAYC